MTSELAPVTGDVADGLRVERDGGVPIAAIDRRRAMRVTRESLRAPVDALPNRRKPNWRGR